MSKVYTNLDLFHIGWDKHGDLDFGVNAVVGELTQEQMKEFRVSVMVAIGIAEQMWMKGQNELQNANMAQA